jgi:hypothetical protein
LPANGIVLFEDDRLEPMLFKVLCCDDATGTTPNDRHLAPPACVGRSVVHLVSFPIRQPLEWNEIELMYNGRTRYC